MIIIWRGFGALALLFGVLGFGLGMATGHVVAAGIGLILAGVGTYFFGQWLNVTKAEQKAQEILGARRQEVEHLVRQGRFFVEGAPAPRTYEEAYALAEQQLAAEAAYVTKNTRNHHTLFWVPMQHWGFVFAGIGVLLTIVGLVS